MGDNRVFVSVRQPAAEVEPALRGLPALTALHALPAAEAGASRFELRAPFVHDLTGAVAALAAERGWVLSELHESRFSLEDTFIALTRAAVRTGAAGKQYREVA